MATDGEVYGLRLALGDAGSHMAHLRNDHDALFRDASAKMAAAQAIIDELRGERDLARAQVGKLKNALALEQCHAAGLMAKGVAYRSLIDRVCPDDKLLQETGLTYPDGASQKYADRYYDKGHDDKAASLGLKHRISSEAK